MERLWSKIEIRGPTECWPWQQRSRDNYGYGNIRVKGKTVTAHRLVYMLEIGPIPEGLEVRHSCDNPPCCNPTHLLLGTHADNMADMVERGRANPQGGRAKREQTHCIHGHEFDEGNTYRWHGLRRCRACNRELQRRKRVLK